MNQALKARFEAVALLLLRFALGGVFLMRGVRHLFGAFGGAGLKGAVAAAAAAGFQPAGLWGPVLAVVEVAGGVSILLGYYARGSAAVLAFVAAVAFRERLAHGFFAEAGGVEHPMTLFAVAASILLLGQGPYSLATYIRLKKARKVYAILTKPKPQPAAAHSVQPSQNG